MRTLVASWRADFLLCRICFFLVRSRIAKVLAELWRVLRRSFRAREVLLQSESALRSLENNRIFYMESLYSTFVGFHILEIRYQIEKKIQWSTPILKPQSLVTLISAISVFDIISMRWEGARISFFFFTYCNDDVYRFHVSVLYFFQIFMLFSNIQIILYLKYVRKMLTFWIIEYFCKFCKRARVLHEKFRKKYLGR